jgi:hypothetical protein
MKLKQLKQQITHVEIVDVLTLTQSNKPFAACIAITVLRRPFNQPVPYPHEFTSYEDAATFTLNLNLKDVYNVKIVTFEKKMVEQLVSNYEVYVRDEE